MYAEGRYVRGAVVGARKGPCIHFGITFKPNQCIDGVWKFTIHLGFIIVYFFCWNELVPICFREWKPLVSVPESWKWIFSFPSRFWILESIFHFLSVPEFWECFFFMPLLFPNFEMEFSIPFPICEILNVNPSHPCWGLLLILLFPCSYISISSSPPYIGRQQWIYGGGCSWYFVPLSTLILMLVSCTTLSLFLPIFECPNI